MRERCAEVADQAEKDASDTYGVEAGIGANIAGRRIRDLPLSMIATDRGGK
jgi:hypothetical protein